MLAKTIYFIFFFLCNDRGASFRFWGRKRIEKGGGVGGKPYHDGRRRELGSGLVLIVFILSNFEKPNMNIWKQKSVKFHGSWSCIVKTKFLFLLFPAINSFDTFTSPKLSVRVRVLWVFSKATWLMCFCFKNLCSKPGFYSPCCWNFFLDLFLCISTVFNPVFFYQVWFFKKMFFFVEPGV